MDIWKHGKYVDTWSIVHFLSGFLLASVFYYFGYDAAHAGIMAFVLLVLWEVFEWFTKIIEPSLNVLADLIIGLAGFFLGVWVFYIEGMLFSTWFLPTLVATLLLATWGFVDYLKRGYR